MPLFRCRCARSVTYSALADHGVVAMGKDPLAAEHTAELVEETAQVAILDKVVEKLGL